MSEWQDSFENCIALLQICNFLFSLLLSSLLFFPHLLFSALFSSSFLLLYHIFSPLFSFILPRLLSLISSLITSPPSFCFVASLQVLSGVTQPEASTASFSTAVIESVSEVLGLPPGNVTGDVVIGNRRSLLATVSMLYTVRIVSDMSSSSIISKLQQAMSSGAFVALLRKKSGLPIDSATSVSITDATPTSAPVSSLEISTKTRGTITGHIICSCICIFISESRKLSAAFQCRQIRLISRASTLDQSLAALSGHCLSSLYALLPCTVFTGNRVSSLQYSPDTIILTKLISFQISLL